MTAKDAGRIREKETNPPACGRRANNVPEVGGTDSSSCLDSGFARRRTVDYLGIWVTSQARDWPFGTEIDDLVLSEEMEKAFKDAKAAASQYERSSEFRRQLR